MKKLILTLTILLISVSAFAGGTIGVSQGLVNSNDKVNNNPIMSLYIEESLGFDSRLFYQSWTGFKPEGWLTSDHSLMFSVNYKLDLGIGPSYERDNSMNNLSLKVRAGYKLW